jgi:hypothetical protein
MTKRYFEVVHGPNETEAAIADIKEWGYPRDLTEDEINDSLFVRYQPSAAVFWLKPMDARKNYLSFHLVIKQECRGELLNDPHAIEGFYTLCEFLRAKKIYAVPFKTNPRVGLLARKHGWKSDDLGYFYEVPPYG